jgi:CubicO group peptidase (beta-lactamase class C family)
MIPQMARRLGTVAAAVVLAVGTAGANGREAHPRVHQALALLQVWLEAQRDFEQIPGLSAAVVHDQQVLWQGGYGFADPDRQAPAGPQTIYSICSISKLFTGVAVMQLRDAGRLRLDDPIAKHLPWFEIRRTDLQGPEITVQGLLTHSAGLPREADFPYWTAPDFAFPAREEIVERIRAQETLYPAASYFQYSNLGLSLAGELVTAASGQPYETWVRQRILEPLGLTSTTSEMPEAQRRDRLASGYSAIGRDGRRVPVPFFTTRGVAPAAGYASSVEDLARFASWQFRVLQRKGGEEVLSANTLREMHRVHWVDPDFETYWGLGFAVQRDGDTTFVGHGGSCPGFRSQVLLQPSERIATVVMANAQGVNTGQMAQRVYSIVAPAVKLAASEPPEKWKTPDPSLESYTGFYATGFAGEVAVLVWEEGLATVGLPTTNPMQSLQKLKKVGDHTFRRIRKDDETLGEAIVFEMGPDGRPERMVWHSNHYRRIR